MDIRAPRHWLCHLLIGLLAGAPFSMRAYAQELYVVKAGDTFSRVILDHLGQPIYGKNGNLEKLARVNPHIRDVNRIKTGDRILLGLEEPARRTPA